MVSLAKRASPSALKTSVWLPTARNSAFLIAVLLIFAPPAATRAHAEPTLLLKTANWDATVDQQFYGVIGRELLLPTATRKPREFAFYLSTKNKKFGILIEKENLAVRRGTMVPITISFTGRDTFRLNARALAGQVVVTLDDSDVAAWTHDFTAGTSMIVSFPTMGTDSMTYDLSGSTPAVQAIATAIAALGVSGLPRPWSVDDQQRNAAIPSPAAPVASSPTSTLPVDRDFQKQQLELVRMEAEKARADLERARLEAERARAEADKAQAQAQVIADANSKAAEEARVNAAKLAQEQRRKAEQAKAEIDAKGSEP